MQPALHQPKIWPYLPNLKGWYLRVGWEPALMFLQQGDWVDLLWHRQAGPWPCLDWKVVCGLLGKVAPPPPFFLPSYPSLPLFSPPPSYFLSLPPSLLPPPIGLSEHTACPQATPWHLGGSLQ